MTHVFSLTDGTTTVNLNDGTAVWTTAYELATAQEGGTDATDNLKLLVFGATYAAVQSTLRSMERLLAAAQRRQVARVGARVYLTAQLDGDAAAWRSEIYAGQLLTAGLADELRKSKIECALLIRRAPFWEGAETELALSGPSQAAATGGITIYNYDVSATYGNWVQVADTQVLGAIPAPIRLRLTNNSGSAQQYRTIHIGVNAFAGPATADVTLEGEDEATGAGADSTVADNSGGKYWTADDYVSGSGVLLGQWVIPAATMAASAGRWWRLLARGFVAGTVWPVLYDYLGLQVLWVGGEVTPPNPTSTTQQLMDLGAVPIPPGAYDASYAACRLGLWGRANPVVDFFQILGVDAYRRVEIPETLTAFAIANGDHLEIDEIEGRAYTVDATGRHPLLSLQESPLVVFPGVTQRLQVLVRLPLTVPIALTFSVQAWYRPRRLTL